MKKFLGILSSTVIIMMGSLSPYASASTNTKDNTEMLEVKEALEELAGDYAFDEVTVGEELPGYLKPLEFDTVEDFEEWLKNPTLSPEDYRPGFGPDFYLDDPNHETISGEPSMGIQSTKKNGRVMFCGCTVPWTFPGGPIVLDYQYTAQKVSGNWQFINISQITATDVTWTNTWVNTTKPFATLSSNKRQATINLHGYHLLGVRIAGFSAGLKAFADYKKQVTAS